MKVNNAAAGEVASLTRPKKRIKVSHERHVSHL
jgi:hypothetical protein